jgi:Metallo-peptidase family M12/IPT/TIG domain
MPTLAALLLLWANPAQTPFTAPEQGFFRVREDFLSSAALQKELLAVSLEVPELGTLSVDLRRLPAPRTASLWIDGQPAGEFAQFLDPRDSLWQGNIAGEPGSQVFLALSVHGSRGWIRSGEQTMHLLATSALAEPGLQGRSRWMSEVEARGLGGSGGVSERCQALQPPGGSAGSLAPAPNPGGSGGPTAYGAHEQQYQCDLVLETDFSFYSLFGSVPAATSYVNALLGAISATYEAEVGCRLDLAQLGIYTSEAADPFEAFSAGGLLEEMRQRWIAGLNQVGDLGQVLSAAPDGGVAYLNVLCNNDYGVGANCSIGGNLPLPVVQGPLNWDYFVCAHELGHNFSTPHTHDYCPPIDQCAPNGYFGGCQTAAVCQPGTIMSYCHLCDGGVGNIAPAFGPQVAQTMRNAVVSSCLDPIVPLPQPPLIASANPSTLTAVVIDGPAQVTLTGTGFTGTTSVSVDGVPLLNLPPQYNVVSDTQITLMFPIVSQLGPHTITVTDPQGSASTSVVVTYNFTPTLEMLLSNPGYLIQFMGLDIYVGGSFGDTVFLAGSTSLAPSSLPGLAEFGIGNALIELYYFGSQQVSVNSGYAYFKIPLSGNLPTGLPVHVQAGLLRFFSPSLPLQMTNVQSGTILF